VPNVEDPQFAADRKVAALILEQMRTQTRVNRDLSRQSRLAIDESRLAIREGPPTEAPLPAQA
jgi:hypothetical protein